MMYTLLNPMGICMEMLTNHWLSIYSGVWEQQLMMDEQLMPRLMGGCVHKRCLLCSNLYLKHNMPLFLCPFQRLLSK